MDGILTNILDVWDGLTEWFVTAIGGVSEVFYVPETGLTLIGSLTILATAFGVGRLIVATVRSYLTMSN